MSRWSRGLTDQRPLISKLTSRASIDRVQIRVGEDRRMGGGYPADWVLWEQDNRELVRLSPSLIQHLFADFWLPVGGGKGHVWEDGGESFKGMGHRRGHYAPRRRRHLNRCLHAWLTQEIARLSHSILTLPHEGLPASWRGRRFDQPGTQGDQADYSAPRHQPIPHKPSIAGILSASVSRTCTCGTDSGSGPLGQLLI